MEVIIGIIGIIIIAIIIICIDESKKKKIMQKNLFNYYLNNTNKVINNNNNVIDEQKNTNNYDIKTQYKKRKFLTDNEKRYYNYLSNYAEKRNFQIISKIRLADLIEVDEKYSTRNIDKKISFSKISSKHIDFALCNKQDLEPLLLIEIDDNSHNRPDRIERDKFIDKSLRTAGYKIIHINNIDNLEKQLDYVTGVI